jgi:hypothetical protein
MHSLTEFKNETTLATIAENPEANLHFLLFAVIIDVSEPLKVEDSSNYVTRIKIVDPSFNYKEEVKLERLKFHKFVHINIFSEKPEEGPKIHFVGDIIRIRRLKFKYTTKGELMGNDVKYSNWLIYSGKKGDSLESNSFKKYYKNVGRKLTKFEEGRLSDLRDWADSFFYKNSLKYISWWNDWKHPSDDKLKIATVHQNVDLILKCTSVATSKKNKISFIDRDNFTFDLYINEKVSLKSGQVIKLRCVEITAQKGKETTRLIKLTPLSSCLLLPTFCCDYRQFEKSAQEKKSPAKSSKSENLPFLEDYAIGQPSHKKGKNISKKEIKEEENFISAIKKSFGNKKATPVSQLIDYQQNFHSHHGQKFFINGYIAGFVSTDPHVVIKKLQLDEKKVIDFRSTDIKEKKDKKTKIIYHFVMHVKDDSVEKTDQFLDVYALTGEYESHLFSTWNILPSNDDVTQWNNLKDSKLNEFEKKMKAMKNPENKVKLVVELMVTKQGKAFYRLVDTIFLPL